jgi:hypothetical protein
MALVGGGGSPNVSGGSTAATGSGINYLGNHAYAHSGLVETANQSVEVTMLQFHTGNAYINTKIMLQHSENTTDDIVFTIKLNNEVIISHTASRVDLSVIAGNYIPMILPPQTNVLITCRNDGGDTARSCFAIVEGRVYA